MKRAELEQYIGNQAQLGGSRHYELTDGRGRNLRAIDVVTGSGLNYTIMPDRGMDISAASYKGANLVYITCVGETHHSFYEPENFGWLRSFTGGLLTTCGLTYLGAPVNDDGEQLGLHGRYSAIPARQVADLSEWNGDKYVIRHKGIIEEGHMFGNKLRLEREIRSVIGENSLSITDKITNFGFKPSPYTILYHMNIGYPLLSENSRLIIDPEKTIPRDTIAEAGINEFRKFIKPEAGYSEQVFIHTMKTDSAGKAHVMLENKKTGIFLAIEYDAKALPWFMQWKMMGKGEYVLGLEPANVPVKNRKELREENILPMLQPGESVKNEISVTVGSISQA